MITGLVVPPGDAGALARAITMLCHDERKCQQMGNAALELVRSRFDIRPVVRRIEKIYDEIKTDEHV